MDDSSQSQTTVKEPKTKEKCKIWLNFDAVLLCVFIICVWTLLSLPIIVYHIPEAEVSSVILSNFSEKTTNTTNTSENHDCSEPLRYATTSDVCLMELANILTSSNCPLDPEGNVLVLKNEETTATQLMFGLNTLGASDECIRKAVPFVCQYLFGLCDGLGVSIQPSSSQCEEIRDTICQAEWIFVEGFGFDLPDCVIFPPEASSCPALNDSNSTNGTDTSDMLGKQRNGTRIAAQECTEGFYRENGSRICIPSCYTWLQYNRGLSIFLDVVIFISAFVGFLTSTVVIILSYLVRKRMLIFPSVFIVYMMMDVLVFALLVMVGFMDRKRLFCSSRSLIESRNEVTPFCVLSGIVFTYVLGQMTLWWLFHVTSLFWKVVFPFHAQSYSNIKLIHITCVILGILLPLVPIITLMANFAVDLQKQYENSTTQLKNSLFLSGGWGFGSNGFPTILCSGSDPNTLFYSFSMIIDIIVASGCTLLLIIFWSIHKVYKIKRVKKNDKFKFSELFNFRKAEMKLLVVFCYYVVLAVIALTVFTMASRSSSRLVNSILRYFFCEQGGHNPSSPCNRSDIENLSHPSMEALSYILLALLPVVNLLYAVNIAELKELWIERSAWLKKSYYTDISSMTH